MCVCVLCLSLLLVPACLCLQPLLDYSVLQRISALMLNQACASSPSPPPA
ncbi:hypothetical protein IF1G_06151 [Cordyceps javanica]|uniref:Uncharacterized protein n=1 Tax=Cordyceps javanica TaxID=43265 RepID=A0A545V0B6_9HYPO|nr:hypothetical protein IF1G_06151 [Cordyceps javanica]